MPLKVGNGAGIYFYLFSNACRFDICLLCWQPFDSRPSMSDLLTTLKDIFAGGKVRWPSKKDPAGVGVAAQQQPGESPSVRGRSGSSSQGHRPKRPAPIKPPSGGESRARPQREDEQSLIFTNNLAVHSQEDPEIERAVVISSRSHSLSQDAGTSAHMDSQRKEKASKSHKKALKRDLSSSTEPLLQSSPSLSAEDDGKADILPIPIVPPPPPSAIVGDGEVTMATHEQKKRKHRKSGEFKHKGEGKQKSKAKRKRRSEHDTSEKKASKSEVHEEQQQQVNVAGYKMMSEPLAEEGELPLPQEIAEAAVINEGVIAGAGVGEGAPVDEKDDFILEPPQRFSQSSVDYLDEFGDIDDSGPLSFDFAPPTAPSDDELEEEKFHPPPPPIHQSPAQQQISGKKKSTTESLEGKKFKRGSKPQQKVEASHEEVEDEWQGLDYPVKHPPLRRPAVGVAVGGASSKSTPREAVAGQTRLVFPRDQENEFDEFAHRDALEEEPDSEDGGGGVVLDEDVAALLW